MTYTFEDLSAIESSDVAFFYINYPVYTGSCVEAGFAFANGKPIILVFELKGSIDSLLLGVSKKVFTDLGTAMRWFKKSKSIREVIK